MRILKRFGFFVFSHTSILIFVLSLVTTLTYSNILPNGFVWDDEVQIVNNTLLQKPNNIWEVITSNSGLDSTKVGFYRPVMNLFYWINFKIFHLSPWGYHLSQLFVHLLNSILVFVVMKRIYKYSLISYARVIAFFTALIFAVHPAISEAVQYLGAVGEPLYVLFALLLLLCITSQIKPAIRLTIITVLGFLAICAKESGITVFITGGMYLIIFKKTKKHFLILYGITSVIALACYALLRFTISGIIYSSNHPSPIAKATFYERLLTIPKELYTYLFTFFWPSKLQIYQDFVVRDISDRDFWIPTLLIFILILLMLMWVYRQRKEVQKLFVLLLIWFTFGLVPSLNIVPLNMTVAGRWLYFASIPMISIVVLVVFQISTGNAKRLNAVILAGFIVAGLLSIRTVIRNQNWRNGYTLYGHDILYSNADSPGLENNYGVELFRKGDLAAAKKHFINSVSLQNDWSVSQNNLGVIFEREGNTDQAFTHYQRSIELSDYALAYQNTAKLLIKLNKLEDAEQFITNKALQKFSDTSVFYGLLATVFYNQKKIPQAMELAQKALSINPNDIYARRVEENIQR